MKFDEALIELLDSYRVGRPTWGLIDGSSIDAQICAESKCNECGHQGMEYHPFVRDDRHSYRAFAVCPKCDETFEF